MFCIQNLDQRHETYFYLVGDCIHSFEEQLPTALEVIKLYCSEWNTMTCETEKIARVVNSIIEIWNQAGIQIRSVPSIRQKVKILVDNLKSIIKSRRKFDARQLKKENDFLAKSACLFDIVNQKLECKLSSMKKLFLHDQRNVRLERISNMNE